MTNAFLFKPGSIQSSEMNPLLLILLGLAVGALTGITGSSGVLVVVPVLTFLGYSFQEAVGVSLAIDVITTTSVVYAYLRYGDVKLRVAGLMGVGAVLGAQLGVRLALYLNPTPLEIAFSLFAGIMAVVSFRRSIKGVKLDNISKVRRGWLALPLSICVGVLTGTLGTSGGIMFIAIMMMIYSMDVRVMIGTGTLAMLLSALSGSLGYAISGNLDLATSLIIGIAALGSGYLFSKLAHRLRPSIIYASLGTVFVITCLSEVIRLIRM
ncbi:sulfite exporter TauE/SafE family protein [Metallosphaera yellowstonensis]|nr:sulfite exporter TauE/SafE family protein [Metallosphaera yellowstonensis]